MKTKVEDGVEYKWIYGGWVRVMHIPYDPELAKRKPYNPSHDDEDDDFPHEALERELERRSAVARNWGK